MENKNELISKMNEVVKGFGYEIDLLFRTYSVRSERFDRLASVSFWGGRFTVQTVGSHFGVNEAKIYADELAESADLCEKLNALLEK